MIRKKLLASDMVVFATPLYYYGMSAQLKTVVDRFCAYNSSLNRRHLKSALLTVAWNCDDWTFDALEAHYKTLVLIITGHDSKEGLKLVSDELTAIFQNLGNEIRGIIWGENVWQKGEVKATKAMEEAYQAGLNI